jgi:mRNA interferase MazF
VVLADAGKGDFVLCQVTSNPYADPRAVQITDDDFRVGSLRVASYARPAKLFTASWDLVTHEIGALKRPAFDRVLRAVLRFLEASLEP